MAHYADLKARFSEQTVVDQQKAGRMRLPSADDDSDSVMPAWHAGSIVLLCLFMYFWVGISPFAQQGVETTSAPAANLINQIIVIALTIVAMVKIWSNPARVTLMAPHGLLLTILAWYALVSIFSVDPSTAFRRIVYAVLVCACANVALLLARNERDFAKVLCVGVVVTLGLSYLMVIAMPGLGIHQANEVEGALAGSWRGHFGHKNSAAAAMAFIVLIGLYLRKESFPKTGTAIVVLATVFLYHAGGKTSTAMLPVVLILGWLIERMPSLRYLMIVCLLVALNTVLLGSAVHEPIHRFLLDLGVDATFTGRDTIWKLALDNIAERPVFGYGFQSFWQSEDLKKLLDEDLTFLAAHSHNSFLEALINAGVPGLLLIIIWLVLLPLRDVGKAMKKNPGEPLTRLFLRIWLFSILLASLESIVFINTGPIWFTMLACVFGLRLQVSADLARQPRYPRTSGQTLSDHAVYRF